MVTSRNRREAAETFKSAVIYLCHTEKTFFADGGEPYFEMVYTDAVWEYINTAEQSLSSVLLVWSVLGDNYKIRTHKVCQVPNHILLL